MDIVYLDGYAVNPGDLSWDGFEKLGGWTMYGHTPINDEAEIRKRIGTGEVAVLTNKTPITAGTIAACPGIRYIGVMATGYNVVDTEAAKKAGIPVTNIPSYGTAVVAQFTIALLLEICHRIGHHNKAVHSGKWAACEDFCFWDTPQIELAGKTLGIIGFGRIGQATAKIALALGMRVIVYNRSESESGKKLAEYVSLDTLFAESDIIALHCPLSPDTQGVINKASIAKMKDGVIILNTARGPLVAEQDLADALDSGKVYAAGVDVASSEPIKEDNPLLKAKNCIITPHMAWAAKESRKRLVDIALANYRAFLDGKPVNVVN